MSKSGIASGNIATSDDVRRLFPHLEDHGVASILALKPTIAELEEAATRSAGASDIFAHVRREKGIVEAIIEIVAPEDDESDDR